MSIWHVAPLRFAATFRALGACEDSWLRFRKFEGSSSIESPMAEWGLLKKSLKRVATQFSIFVSLVQRHVAPDWKVVLTEVNLVYRRRNVKTVRSSASLLHIGHYVDVSIPEYVIMLIPTKSGTRFHFSEFTSISNSSQTDCSTNKCSAIWVPNSIFYCMRFLPCTKFL